MKIANLKVTVLVLAIALPITAFSQNAEENLKPEEYFDFWVGEWDLTWEAPDGTIEKGTNTVERILNGNVILENFESVTGRFTGYKGKSFSVYHKRSGTWRQTWVDSNTGYIDLTGKIDGNKRIFETEGPGPGGKTMLKRMVFYEITGNSFTWDWETSVDDGETWKLQWRITYKRK